MLYKSKLLPFILNFVQSKTTNPNLDPVIHDIGGMRVRYLGLVAAILRISCAFFHPLDEGAKSRRLHVDLSSVQLPACAVRLTLQSYCTNHLLITA